MMADYNGWTDQREEEREALDQLEMTPTAAGCGSQPQVAWNPLALVQDGEPAHPH